MRNVNVNSIGDYIREQREQAKISMRQLAQSAGVSNPYLSQIERGLRKPSADILQQIAKGLRISAEALYVQAGILEDRQADSGVRSALLADTQLSERQKQVLIEIYESFRRENASTAEATADADTDAEGPAELTAGAPGAEADALEAAAMEAAAEAMEAEAMEAEAMEAEAMEAEPSTVGAARKAAAGHPGKAAAGHPGKAAGAAETPDQQSASAIRPNSASD